MRADEVIYVSYRLGCIPVRKKLPRTNVNQILFGQLGKVAKEVDSLGWPTPKVPGGINRLKQFFVILTNDHQTIAVSTSAYSKRQATEFMSGIKATGVALKTD